MWDLSYELFSIQKEASSGPLKWNPTNMGYVSAAAAYKYSRVLHVCECMFMNTVLEHLKTECFPTCT